MAAQWAKLAVTADSFKAQIEHTEMSYRDFADEVAREMTKLRRKRRKPGDPVGCSHATISKLANGTSTTAHPLRAMAIEKAARVPRGSLFRLEVERVSWTADTPVPAA